MDTKYDDKAMHAWDTKRVQDILRREIVMHQSKSPVATDEDDDTTRHNHIGYGISYHDVLHNVVPAQGLSLHDTEASNAHPSSSQATGASPSTGAVGVVKYYIRVL